MFLCILYFCVPGSVCLFLLQEQQSVICYTFVFVLYHFIIQTDPLHMKLQQVLQVSLPVDLFNAMIFAMPFTGCFSLLNWLLVHGFELLSVGDEFQLLL